MELCHEIKVAEFMYFILEEIEKGINKRRKRERQ